MEFEKHFKLNSMLKYITVILCIVSTTVNADIKPNYNNPDKKIYVYDARDSTAIFLSCKPTPGASQKFKWKKNEKDVSEVESLKNRYEIKEGNFIIRETSLNDDGNYTCQNEETEETANIEVISNVYIKKFPTNLAVIEGEQLHIVCKVFGTDPNVAWTINGAPIPNGTHIVTKDDGKVKNAILVINHAELEDRTFYNCTVSNKANVTVINNERMGEDKDGTFVRVKEKYAALWPFFGICAEVFILCAIILVYEKRRNKEGLEESDTDQSPEQEKLKTGK